jgi:hypothetical protein
MVPPWLKDKRRPHQTRLLAEPHESNYTGVQTKAVRPLRGFLAIQMSGPCSRPREVGLESSPTASACCVVLRGPECDGSGTVKTMSGPKSTANSSGDGSMWILVKSFGILLGCIQKVSNTSWIVETT